MVDVPWNKETEIETSLVGFLNLTISAKASVAAELWFMLPKDWKTIEYPKYHNRSFFLSLNSFARIFCLKPNGQWPAPFFSHSNNQGLKKTENMQKVDIYLFDVKFSETFTNRKMNFSNHNDNN